MGLSGTSYSQTLYIPTFSPPTPSPSPSPSPGPSTTPSRRAFLTSVLHSCTPSELLFLSESLAPLLRRDFLSALPTELGLHILGFIHDPKTLVRTSAVSWAWRRVATAEAIWRPMCVRWGLGDTVGVGGDDEKGEEEDEDDEPLEEMEPYADLPMDAALEWLTARKRRALKRSSGKRPTWSTTYRAHFKTCYIKILNWHRGGRLLRSHRLPMLAAPAPGPAAPSRSTITRASTPAVEPDTGVVTSLAMDGEWVVVGLASSRIHVFSAKTGVLARTLVGHESGVWGLCLVSASRPRGKEKARQGDVGFGREAESDGLYTSLVPALRAALGLSTEEDEECSVRDAEFGNHDDDDDMHNPTRQSTSAQVTSDPHLPHKTTHHHHHRRQGAIANPSPVAKPGSGSRSTRANDALNPFNEEEDHPLSTAHTRPPPASTSRSPLSQPRHNLEFPYPNPNQEEPPQGYRPERQSDPCFASEGWGQPNALVVSGGCDKVVRVWDVKSGHCIYTLPGHRSTIRCMRTSHAQPLAITGSRDGTVRTWDIQKGKAGKVMEGHTASVRSVDVNGRRAVSGSYDTTCRIWDLETGECLHVLRGHFQELYTVAFDGVLVATGGLDTTVRVWDAETGHCLALLQGHTGLVCQLQLSRKHQLLATGGSDGRVVTFALSSSSGEDENEYDGGTVIGGGYNVNRHNSEDDLHPAPPLRLPTYPHPQPPPQPHPLSPTSSPSPSATHTPTPPPPPKRPHRKAYEPLHRMSAHASSVTALQFDGRFMLTGGNDGSVHLWETETGRFVRRMTGEGEGVWKAGFAVGRRGRGGGGELEGDEEGEGVGDVCVIVGRRTGKTVLEVWGFGEE